MTMGFSQSIERILFLFLFIFPQMPESQTIILSALGIVFFVVGFYMLWKTPISRQQKTKRKAKTKQGDSKM